LLKGQCGPGDRAPIAHSLQASGLDRSGASALNSAGKFFRRALSFRFAHAKDATTATREKWSEVKQGSNLNRRVQLAFGSAILTLVVIGVISYRVINVFSESDQWIDHTHLVLTGLQDLLFALNKAESGFRGFILTGQQPYLQAYHDAMAIASRDQASIHDLTIDNFKQQQRFPLLDSLTDRKVKYSEALVELRRTQGAQAAIAALQSGPGQQIMDSFQAVIGDMEKEESGLLLSREADAMRRLSQTKIILILGTLLGIFIAAGAGWMVCRDIAARRVAEEALATNARAS
jgi:CHASE3 domain sensor protein